MSAQALSDANDIEYETLQNELLVDGWRASEPTTGLIQAVWAYAPSAPSPGHELRRDRECRGEGASPLTCST